VPVWADWVGGFGLLPDGQVVFLPHKSAAPPEAVLEPHLRHVTYLAASRRYPEFASLAPRRGPDDPTCPSCGGTGHVAMPDGTPAPPTLVCFCGGSGWLPAGYDNPAEPIRG
jgi:hypothetical protein